MDATTIKKELYKQKPVANLVFIRLGVAYYNAVILNADQEVTVEFQVPVNDMGDTDFYPEMDGKLLNRYISNF
jgi:hypothetical protein